MKPHQNQTSFLDALHSEDMELSVADWTLPELPDLDRFDWFVMDLESTGLRWWDTDRMIGAAVWTPDNQVRYLPIRHKVGPNIPEEQFFRWLKRIRSKRMVNIRTKFDLHLLRMEGVDLEAQGNTFGDVAHYAALLDDHRRRFNQADLARDYLMGKILPPGEDGKVKHARGFDLDPTKFAEYPAGLVAERACSDARVVSLLHHVMYPMLTEQDLHRVREIEDAIIPVVVDMEHNGAPIDVERLNTWCEESRTDLEQAMWEIQRLSGCRLETPDKREDVVKMFHALRLPLPLDPEEERAGREKVSFADDLLKDIKHPAIQKLREAKALASLRSKFLLKYQRSVARDGILRYELHQLPYQDDDKGGGAVSGRFSSAAPSRDEGANIQQVFGVKSQLGYNSETKQNEGFTRKYLIKNLFLPDRRTHKDAVWMKADASQFQFRLFAHYSEDPKLLSAYADDLNRAARGEKLTDFHDAVHDLILEYSGVDLSRTHTKNVNFAQVFAAKERKMAEQLGVPFDQIPSRGTPLEEGGPEFLKVLKLSRTYHEMFPRVAPLLKLTEHLAMPDHQRGDFSCGRRCRDLYRQGYTHRGYVKTYLGRRARFAPHDRHYSALNRIIQGTEGDVNKRVMVEMHKLRHELGLTPRFTVHDEYDTDLHDPGNFARVKDVLNTQYYDFKVPILWEAAQGPSWGEAK